MSGAGDVALATVAGGLLTLERKAFGQFMLSRPLVVAPIIAALLGDGLTGLALGVVLELFFLGTASYGASTPDHETLAAIFAASLAASAAGDQFPPPASLALAIYLALPFAVVGRHLEAALERWNVGLVDRAEEFLAEGRPARATRQALVGALGSLLLGASVTALGTLLGPPLGGLEEHLPVRAVRALGLAWALFVGVSSAMALRAIRTPGGASLSGVAALTVFVFFALSTWFLH